MIFFLQPWHLLLSILASWISRQQQQRIQYLQTEVAVLKEHIVNLRILLTDKQRRRLAFNGKFLGLKALDEIGSPFTPDIILRLNRQLVAEEWDYSDHAKNKAAPQANPECGSSQIGGFG